MKFADMLGENTPTVMGIKLRPYCLGHVVHLQQENSLFLTTVRFQILENVTPQENVKRMSYVALELAMAALICGMTYEECTHFKECVETLKCLTPDEKKELKRLNKPNKRQQVFKTYGKTVEELAQVEKVYGDFDRTIKKLVKSGQMNLLFEVNKFNAYTENGSQFPDYDTVNKGEVHQSGTNDNWTHNVRSTLLAETNLSQTEIYNQPLQVTLFDFFKCAERNGMVKFTTDIQQQLKKQAGITI